MKTEFSPITGKPMKIISENEKVVFRGEEYSYIHFSYLCGDSKECFTTTELDGVNINQVYNAYRERHRYPFPDEIRALRVYYGVSAAMMSEIMGFGTNQWRYYEADKVPSESNARAICAIRSKSVFLDFLEASKIKIGEKAYTKIRERVDGLPNFIKPASPSEKSGYVSFSSKKTAEAIKYFTSKLGKTFVTKMNKLLFYADFLTYKREGFGMTGMEYRAITYGPVPNGFGSIYDNASGVECEDYIYPNGTSGILLQSSQSPDMSVFSETEKEILEEVCERFRDSSAGEISAISHKEKGWIECNGDKKLIPYSYAFELNDSEF